MLFPELLHVRVHTDPKEGGSDVGTSAFHEGNGSGEEQVRRRRPHSSKRTAGAASDQGCTERVEALLHSVPLYNFRV